MGKKKSISPDGIQLPKKHKKHHRRIIKKLTPEQKAKRKARLKKIGKAFLWLNPATQSIMVAQLIRDKVKAKRAKKKAAQNPPHPNVESIIDSIQNVVAAEAAVATGQGGRAGDIVKGVGETVSGINPIDQVLDSAPSGDTLDSAAETASEPSETISEDSGEHLSWAYAEGEIPSKTAEVIAKAKEKANLLPNQAEKAMALAEIADLEKSLKESYGTAKSVAKSADANDAVEISVAIKKANPKAIAASVSSKDIAPEKAESKPKDEKQALGEPTESGVPKWAIVGGGALLVGGIAYWYFGKKGSTGK